MDEPVEIVFEDGEVVLIDFPSEDEVKSMRDFSDKMVEQFFPNLDDIVSGPG